MVATSGKEVAIEYTIRLEDSTVVNSNVGNAPFVYVQGTNTVLSCIEEAVEGMAQGENKQFRVEPEKAYGHFDEKAFREVGKKIFSEDTLTVGTRVALKDTKGNTFNVGIAEILEDTVLVNLNHPLAGKTLYFDITVLKIKDA